MSERKRATRATASKGALMKRADMLDATVETGAARMLDVTVYAPDGMVFDGGLHALVGHQLPGVKASEVYGDLLERMERGVSACEDATCDTCSELEGQS